MSPAPDAYETQKGYKLVDRYGRPLYVVTPKHSAPRSSDIIGSDGTYDSYGREQVVLVNDAGADLLTVIETITVNVKSYGAVGDGVSNDSAAIQAAIDDVELTGGEVFFPTGTYLVETTQSAFGLTWCLSVTASNVHLNFAAGASLKTTQNAKLIWAVGAGKPLGALSWPNYWLGDATKNTYYAMSPAVAGARTITLTTPAQAGNFLVGDLLHIRTGQCNVTTVTEPDAELNQVLDANSGTGVITLRWPLAKPYSQEYYISGVTGKTSTSVTANLAVFGVAKVSDRVIENFRISNLTIDAPNTTSSALDVMAAIGVRIIGLRGSCGGNVVNNIETRGCRFRDWKVRSVPTTAGIYRWAFAFGTSCSDGIVEDVEATGEGARMMVFHVHEGAADIDISNSRCVSPAGSADNGPLSIRGRSYNLRVRNVELITAANNFPVYVSGECVAGGVLENVKAVCLPDATKGIWIDDGAIGWQVRSPHPTTPVLASTSAPQNVTPTYQLVGWVADDKQNPTLGVLPARAYVTGVRVHVTELFNGAGTDLLTVGYDASVSAYVTSLDVSTTGVKAPTLGTEVGYNGTSRSVEAYYTAGGGAPTTGKALVIVEYMLVPIQVA